MTRITPDPTLSAVRWNTTSEESPLASSVADSTAKPAISNSLRRMSAEKTGESLVPARSTLPAS